MESLFYLPKSIIYKQAKDLYDKQEKEKNPGVALAYLDEKVTTYKTIEQSQVPCRAFLNKIKRFTTVIIWDLSQITIPLDEFEKIVIAMANKSIIIQFLNPKMTIKPESSESLFTLHLMSRSAQITGRYKCMVKPSFSEKLTDDLIAKLRKDRKDGLFIADIAKKHKISTKAVCKYTKDLSEAVRLMRRKQKEKLKREAVRRILIIPDLNPESNLTAYTASFLEYQRSDYTRTIYFNKLKKFFAFTTHELHLSISDPKQITVDMAQSYLKHLEKEKRQAGAIGLSFAPLKAFFTYLNKTGISNRNPFKLVKLPIRSSNSLKSDSLEPREIRDILNYAHSKIDRYPEVGNKRKTATRNYLIVYLLSSVGMRLGGLLSIRLKDVKAKNGITTLTMDAKNSDRYTLSISTHNAQAIEDYINTYLIDSEPEHFLFNGITRTSPLTANVASNVILKLAKDLGMNKKVTAKMFRVAWATEAFLNDMPEKRIMRQLNHKSLNQTMAYIRLAENCAAPAWVPAATKIENHRTSSSSEKER